MGKTRARARKLVARARAELVRALEARHTPKQVAASFALGIFITALPTLGTGLLVFVVVAALFASVSRIALFASVIVLNPAVKWGVYAASYGLGSRILGPAEGVSVRTVDVSLAAGPEVVTRLLLGNLILACALTVVAYVLAHRFTVEYRRRTGGGLISDTLDDVV